MALREKNLHQLPCDRGPDHEAAEANEVEVVYGPARPVVRLRVIWPGKWPKITHVGTLPQANNNFFCQIVNSPLRRDLVFTGGGSLIWNPASFS
jgi:hypothetical protein